MNFFWPTKIKILSHVPSPGPQSPSISTHALRSLHWLKIKQLIDYKILSLTYEVITISHIYIIVSLFSPIVALVTLSCSLYSSSLKVNNLPYPGIAPGG